MHAPCRRDILLRLVPRLLGAPEAPSPGEGEDAGAAEEGALFEGVPAAHVHGMMQEQTASHVLEVPPGALPDLLSCCFDVIGCLSLMPRRCLLASMRIFPLHQLYSPSLHHNGVFKMLSQCFRAVARLRNLG